MTILALLPLLVVAALLGVLALAVIVVLVRRRNAPPAAPYPPSPGLPTLEQRTAELRRRTDHWRGERLRVLGMVEDGRITPEEALRLSEALERETTTMACAFCGGEIRTEAVTCKHCGACLVAEYSRPTVRRLCRSRDKVLAGVCGGLAEYAALDPALVRILTAVAVFLSGILTGLVVYLVAALIMPAAEAPGVSGAASRAF